MYTPEPKIDYMGIAAEISEWIERNYGYFVNKTSNKIIIIDDFAYQLKRLPVENLSYIQRTKNSFFDQNLHRPPLPCEFIAELKLIANKNKNKAVNCVMYYLRHLKTEKQRLNYIKHLQKKGLLLGLKNTIVGCEVTKILKKHNIDLKKQLQ